MWGLLVVTVIEAWNVGVGPPSSPTKAAEQERIKKRVVKEERIAAMKSEAPSEAKSKWGNAGEANSVVGDNRSSCYYASWTDYGTESPWSNDGTPCNHWPSGNDGSPCNDWAPGGDRCSASHRTPCTTASTHAARTHAALAIGPKRGKSNCCENEDGQEPTHT